MKVFKENILPRLGLTMSKIATTERTEAATMIDVDTSESGDTYDAQISSVVKA